MPCPCRVQRTQATALGIDQGSTKPRDSGPRPPDGLARTLIFTCTALADRSPGAYTARSTPAPARQLMARAHVRYLSTPAACSPATRRSRPWSSRNGSPPVTATMTRSSSTTAQTIAVRRHRPAPHGAPERDHDPYARFMRPGRTRDIFSIIKEVGSPNDFSSLEQLSETLLAFRTAIQAANSPPVTSPTCSTASANMSKPQPRSRPASRPPLDPDELTGHPLSVLRPGVTRPCS